MSDYLWDRSGEPDKEIQELEELLAPLGYRPRPLQIPADVAPERRRRLYPALAIAATIALAALALGLWLTISHDSAVQPSQVAGTPVQKPDPKDEIPPPQVPEEQERIVAAAPTGPANESVHYSPDRPAAKRNRTVHQAPQPSAESIAKTEAEAEEGEAAKEQLLTALRIVSVKLNHAQQRTQGGNFGNQIRYQHKVG